MLNKALLAVATLIPFGVAAYPDGAPPGHVGAGYQPDCSTCHFAGPDPQPQSGLELRGLPERVEAGQLYELVLLLRDPEGRVGGFQVMVETDDGDQAGELIPVAGQQVQDHEGLQYLGHAEVQSSMVDRKTGQKQNSWVVNWRAPSQLATFQIFMTAVAGDNDQSPLGDNAYRLKVTLSESDVDGDPE